MANNWLSDKVYLKSFKGLPVNCSYHLSPLVSLSYFRKFEYIIEESSNMGVRTPRFSFSVVSEIGVSDSIVNEPIEVPL